MAEAEIVDGVGTAERTASSRPPEQISLFPRKGVPKEGGGRERERRMRVADRVSVFKDKRCVDEVR